MKILSVGAKESFNSENYYNRAFRSLGHEVTHIDQYQGIAHPNLDRLLLTRTRAFQRLSSKFPINKILPAICRKSDPDVILIFKGELVSTKVLQLLKPNYRLYLLYPDAYRYPAIIRASIFDALFVETERTDFYRSLGAKRVYTVYQACDPAVHRDLELPALYDVSLVGTLYPNRLRAIRELDHVDVFTKFWWLPLSRKHPAVYGEDYVRVINETKINLNIEHPNHELANAPHMRIFEVAGCGGFLLSSDIEAIHSLFPMVPTWRSISEAKELISCFLNDPASRREVSSKLQRECYEKHTYLHRAKKISALVA